MSWWTWAGAAIGALTALRAMTLTRRDLGMPALLPRSSHRA